MLVDQEQGASSALGHLVDLSEGGCQLRLQRSVGAHRAARVRLDIGGRQMWFPVLTRWVRPEGRDWTVGCCFDRLTPEKQESLRLLLAELAPSAS